MDNRIIKSIFIYLTISLGLVQAGCLKHQSVSDIQTSTKKLLAEKVLQVSADSGLVMIMEVNTGKIIADISVVNKDSSIIKVTEKSNHSKHEGFGGLIQPFALMAALESGNITMEDSVDTEHGLIVYKGHRILDSNYDHGGYGKIEVNSVLRLGSDIGVFRSLIRAFGEHQADYFYQLNKIISALPFMIETHRVDSAKQYLPSIEYGLQLNPLQVLVLYNTIANNGQMVYEGKVLDPSIVSPTTLTAIHRALQKVVSPEGTGRLALSDKVSIAGKTGACLDTIRVSGVCSRSSSFCGYFPAENPQYSCLIRVYFNEENMTANGSIPARIFKELAEKLVEKR